MWTSSGCRANFELNGKSVACTDTTESANPLHAESGAFETESALEPVNPYTQWGSLCRGNQTLDQL